MREFVCPSCSQTLLLESLGEFECPHCSHEFTIGVDELMIGRALWKDQSPGNRLVASIISTAAVLIGVAILLIAALVPPLAFIVVVILIPYLIIAPRVLEAYEIIGSSWRLGEGDGSGGGGSGGG
tara:strand:- start:34 stop:408 length:375 start_codon:yes stop_codon:yes gene_type:complete